MCSAVCCRRQCGTQMLQCAVYDNFGIRCTHTTTASQPNAMHIACTSDIHTLLLVVHKQCDGGVQNRSHRRIEKHAAHTCAHCYHLPSTYIVHTHKCIHCAANTQKKEDWKRFFAAFSLWQSVPPPLTHTDSVQYRATERILLSLYAISRCWIFRGGSIFPRHPPMI